ncbi:proline dehydrogenase family protein [Desulfoluna spongiiphila]|uniref:proline dehydrogenase family protein n=1 Tax=Desulfoluna spongiiphila TaxID=419481 RepID=UPI001258C222|nr:proline dehydrogenase family protein [Desulfoluna spongiiphila]VVS93518.1 bifunctional protein puta [Desulfoluna spongiiphila]
MEKQTEARLVQEAVALAEQWQTRANELLTPDEKKIQKMMKRLLTHPMDKVILTRMIDESFRSSLTPKVADRVYTLLKEKGIPKFMGPLEKSLMMLFMGVGRHLPWLAVPQMVEQIRKQSSRAVVPGEEEPFKAHLAMRKEEGVRMNINHIGEAVLGEEEAAHRLEAYVRDLSSPDIEYISVKISTIYSQISSLAMDDTVAELKKRLTVLFTTAENHTYTRKDGTTVKKFVNLDMEEYRDLELTARAFMETLEQEELKNHAAGIVLQAYLPDSWAMQRRLTEWAKERVAAGGAPIKLRIVKGANMEMEQVESALHNWPLAPFDNKPFVDANYKRMAEYAMEPENIKAVRLGIASHNLFELAFAYAMAKENQVTEYFGFEMLEGMADHVRRAILETTGDVLLYAPVAGKEQFINAIAYLIRRLDENTAPENFLRYANDLKPGSREWTFLEKGFKASLELRETASKTSNRVQDRSTESWDGFDGGSHATGRFVNEADTDWALSGNRVWAEGIRDSWMPTADKAPHEVPVVVAGEERFDGKKIREGVDPSQFSGKKKENIVSARYALADDADAEEALETAVTDPDGWRSLGWEGRHEVLCRVAVEIRKARGDLMGAAAAATGKLITEADVEVSEAIDFVEFYPLSARKLAGLEGVTATGKGVGLVISPWNFPIAIPCGGISASLAAGNTVIFKPASDAVLPAWILCNCFWRAGVSKKVLQFMPCSGATTGQKLATDDRVDYVILTGGTDTGLALLKAKPTLALSAETGGKNATIVTSMSDRDQAIKNVIHSAFGNTGQKCSATSLLILEKDVYEDAQFRQQLVDAARSWYVGSAWEYKNSMGTLVNPPSGDLKRGLTELEPGEEWALKPAQVGDNPYLWSPGVKYNVKPGSYTHMTEFFGPVLGVMKADNLEHAISLVNQTGFGLTSGIESLDDREQALWKNSIKAGNLYINRGTTGAIVLRQPFGGMGKSAIGSGIKAGSPNYVSQFMALEETPAPVFLPVQQETHLFRCCQDLEAKAAWGGLGETGLEIARFVRSAFSCMGWYEAEFQNETDHFRLRGQDNIVRYLPVGHVVVRATAEDSLADVLTMCTAALVTGNQVTLSLAPGLSATVGAFIDSADGTRLLRDVTVVKEGEASLAAYLQTADRIRFAAPDRVPDTLLAKAAETGFYIARTRVLAEGRVELLQYVREQSICDNYHRYGNLGERGLL